MEHTDRQYMPNIFDITNKPVLILYAYFYQDMAEMLTEAAISEIEQVSLSYQLVTVPGVFELPAALAMAIESQRFSAYLALGCVIRGETSHYDYVCQESARGLNDLAISHHLAFGYGVITAENKEQAYARADRNGKNVGGRAAMAALAMLKIKSDFKNTTTP